MQILLVVAAILLLGPKLGYSQDTDFVCRAQTNCNDCIQASPSCIWCTDPSHSEVRCFSSESNIVCGNSSSTTNNNNIQNPTSHIVSISNETFTDFNQISPQTVSLSIRRGQPVKFNVTIKPAPNYPLDLYLLMDLSYSMNNDLQNLKSLGGQIASTIRDISTNYQLGFGSFVDKPLAPYVDIRPSALNSPCGGCEGPYSFRHGSTLGNDSDRFDQGIQNRVISGNRDAPEGGFDGFLQSTVCQELIGWRRAARHLLLYITDAGFHYAGDGKLGGALLPNPGQCLMPPQSGNAAVDYRQYHIYDYPSVGQIRQKLREYDIIPLFAAERSATQFYTALAAELEGADVGELAGDSSNIITLIQESYRRVSQRVIISPDNVPGLSFNITPISCPTVVGQECRDVTLDRNATFEITANLLQCSPELSGRLTSVNFRVLGFGSFTVNVSTICSCGCEEQQSINSSLCSNAGTSSCGICECNEGRFGDQCQCDGRDATSTNSTMCEMNDLGQVCSGRGTCICGRCICNSDNYFGKNCECDNLQCDRAKDNDAICGGPGRGVCTCDGQCQCLTSPISGEPYTGSACDCSPDDETCKGPGDQAVCSGNGMCECGECTCNSNFAGTYCQICTTTSACPVASCNDTLQCAMCLVDPTGSNCDACNDTINRVTGIGSNYMISGSRAIPCDFTSGDCEYRYYVALDDEGNPLPIHFDDDSGCQESVAPWIIAVALIAALLIIGLIILAIIKLLLMLLDYMEVKKFMAEVSDPKFRKNENPLFQSPNKEYKNPTYGQ